MVLKVSFTPWARAKLGAVYVRPNDGRFQAGAGEHADSRLHGWHSQEVCSCMHLVTNAADEAVSWRRFLNLERT